MANSRARTPLQVATSLKRSLVDVLAGTSQIDDAGVKRYLDRAWNRVWEVSGQIKLFDELNLGLLCDAANLLNLAKAAKAEREYVTALLLALTGLEQLEAAAGWLTPCLADVKNDIADSWEEKKLNLQELCRDAAASLEKRGKVSAGNISAETTSFTEELFLYASRYYNRPFRNCWLLAILADRQAIKESNDPGWKIGLQYFAGTEEILPILQKDASFLRVKPGQQITLKVTGLQELVRVTFINHTNGFGSISYVRDPNVTEVWIEKLVSENLDTVQWLDIEIHEKTGSPLDGQPLRKIKGFSVGVLSDTADFPFLFA